MQCVVIGEGTLPLQCAEMILSYGHELSAIVSPDARLIRWAEERNIPTASHPNALLSLLDGQPFDYLFSIVNYQILPPEVLAAPRGWAINYHDAPLPRYAGSYATSWALMHQERNYAVSWHLMSAQVDAGAILVQYPVEIAPDERALTLNAKCYDAALRSFALLLSDLATGRAQPQPQQLSERTFFARRQRPPNMAICDWRQDAEITFAMVRALQFGPYPNGLGLPKLVIGQALWLFDSMIVSAAHSQDAPGTVVAYDDNSLTIATATADIVVCGLRTITGEPTPVVALVEQGLITLGEPLDSFPDALVQQMTEQATKWSSDEPFWVTQLSGIQPATLPGIQQSTAVQTAYQRADVPLPSAVRAHLEALEAGQRANWLIAAFALYVARLNDASDIALGLWDAQRTAQIGDSAPLFESIVPLRCTFDTLQDAGPQLANTLTHIERVRRAASYPREIALRYPTIGSTPHWPIVIAVGEADSAAAAHESAAALVFHLTPQADACWLTFDPQQIEEAQVPRIANQLAVLFGALLDEPHTPIAHLPLLTAAERQFLLGELNRTAAPFPQDQCIHELFAAQVARTPDLVALVANDPHGNVVTLTYRELEARANRLAHLLQQHGVTNETLVGVMMERSVDLVVSLLAILKAGGAYVPIDPAYPDERIEVMLEDARATVVLTEPHLAQRLGGTTAQILNFDAQLRATLEAQPSDPPISGATAEHLAYVLFTSGSTGRPKGVMIEHRSVAALIGWAQSVYSPAELAGVLFATSICFDLSIFELFVPLSSGGTVLLVENALELPNLRTPIAVTLLNTVPSVIAELLRAEAIPPTVRTLNLAGEPLSTALVQQLYAVPTIERVYDLYGPSEDTTYSTYALRRADGPATIGRPVANTHVYLLDAHLQPVPLGMPGELYLSGAGLARGYLHRPDLTAERFVPNPFSAYSDQPTPPSRMYRTGDLARYAADGSLEFLGRIDHQVKIRGFRIELGEIEATIRLHPAVADAVVVASDGSDNSKQLVAYVALNNDVKDSSAAIREQTLDAIGNLIRERLPAYMMPAQFVVLEQLPRLPNGKLNRKALPKPERISAQHGNTYVAPRDHVETLLVNIWQQALGVEHIGVYDNFFALGGDSIIAIQIIARASQVGLRLAARQLFQHQTIAALAAVTGQVATARAEQEQLVGDVPLTPIQRWFFEHELPERHHWNQAMLFELLEPCDSMLLGWACEQLVHHHDALRLRFVEDSQGWRQFYAASSEAVLVQRVDLSVLAPEAQPQAMREAMEAAQSSLHLEFGPLLRVVWFDRGADVNGLLFIAIHHLAVDGVSWRILSEDLGRLLRDRSPLPPKTSSFRAWSNALLRHMEGGQRLAELDYWLRIGETPMVPMPLDFAAPPEANTEDTAQMVIAALDRAETQALLQDVLALLHVQINDALLTALTVAWSNWTGQSTVLLELEGHGREDIDDQLDLSRTVGWFTAIFPVALRIDPAADLMTNVQAIRAQLAAVPQRGIGYGLLRYLGGPQVAEQLRALPQAEISFNYLGQFDQGAQAERGLRFVHGDVGPLHSPKGLRFHRLEITGRVIDGRLQFEWVYSDRLHARHTIERLAHDFMAVLRLLISSSDVLESRRQIPHAPPQPTSAIEAIGRATPAQQALWAALCDIPTTQAYRVLWHGMLRGEVDSERLREAWQTMVVRHAALRTTFAEQPDGTLQQIVHRQGDVPWVPLDWRALPAEEQQRQLQRLIHDDRLQGYDLTHGPLLRVMLVRLAEEQWWMGVGFHHLILDGWSMGLLMRDLLAQYDTQPQESPAVSVLPYTEWCERQDTTEARAFWRRMLQDATPTRVAHNAQGEPSYHEQQRQLSAATTQELRQFAQQSHITLNTLVQGAVALLLHQLTRRHDVVLGVTQAGRPAEYAGAEAMVGMLANTLPLRVSLAGEQPLAAWLRELQLLQSEIAQYSFVSAEQVHEWANGEPQVPLFDTIVRFQNYPLQQSMWKRKQFQIHTIEWVDHWHYPLCFIVVPGETLSLSITYDRRSFNDLQINTIFDRFLSILSTFSIHNGKSIREVLELIDMVGV